MHRAKFAAVCSAVLLLLVIIVLPDQFLFSKTVPNSFWTEHFPLPFGAGWFISFIVLFPAVWFGESVVGAIKNSLTGVLISICMAVPIALFVVGGTLSPNNLLNQYLWLGIICIPPLILQIFMWSLYSRYVKNG